MTSFHRLVVAAAVFVAFPLALGCSSSDSTAPVGATDTGGASDTGAGSETTPLADADDSSPAETAAESGDETGAKPATPTITTLAKMGGALHVSWKLNDTGLTSVELWRNKDGGAYAKVYTLPGTATNQHDTGATGAFTYCFKVMTFRDAAASDFSPEKCGMP